MQATQLPLKDIHTPAAIGWWPPAIGWWILAILVLLLVGLGVWLYKRATRKTALKTAQALLAEIKLNTEQDGRQKLQSVSALMRRVAISISPRSEVASLTGSAWLAFLDKSATDISFQTGVGQLLAQAPYQQTTPSQSDISELISLCEDWLKHCPKRKP